MINFVVFLLLLITPATYATNLCSLWCGSKGPVCNVVCPDMVHFELVQTMLQEKETLLREHAKAHAFTQGLLVDSKSTIDKKVRELTMELDTCLSQKKKGETAQKRQKEKNDLFFFYGLLLYCYILTILLAIS